MEAELLAVMHAAKKLYWWKRFFASIQLDPGHDAAVDCDNQQMIGLMIKDLLKLTTKLRHVNIHKHWLRQEVQEKRLRINWVPTAEMTADGLTKVLPLQKHEIFIKQLDLINVGKRLEELL